MITPSGLSLQEVAEADSMVGFWQNISRQRSAYITHCKDIEEVFLALYGKINDAAKGQERFFEDAKWLLEKIQASVRALHQSNTVITPDTAVPTIRSVTKDAYDRFGATAGISDITLLFGCVDILMGCMVTRTDIMDSINDGVQKAMKTWSSIVDEWQAGQKELRQKLEQFNNFQFQQDEILSLMKVWSQGNEARRQYLKAKGIVIEASQACQVLQAKQCGPAVSVSLRRQKRAKLCSKASEQSPAPAEEKPWEIVCVTANETPLGTAQIMLSSDDGTWLAEALMNHYDLFVNSGHAVQKKIAKFVELPLAGRQKLDSFRLGGKIWSKIRLFKRWRMLLRIDQDKRLIHLMVFHTTKQPA